MPDVNVLIGSMRIEDPRHAQLSEWLGNAVDGHETLGLSVLVLGGVVRIMSHRGLLNVPKPTQIVIAELERLLRHRNVELVYPGPKHWDIFAWLCKITGITGGRISDLQHAAIAIEHDATWVSLDQDFARVPSLRWELPTV